MTIATSRETLDRATLASLGLPRQSFRPQARGRPSPRRSSPMSPSPRAASRGSPTSRSVAAARSWWPGSPGSPRRSRPPGWPATGRPTTRRRARSRGRRPSCCRSASRSATPSRSTSCGRRPAARARGGVAERIDALVAEADGLEGIGRGAGGRDADVSRDGTIGVLRIPLTELPGAVPAESGKRLIELAEQASGEGVRIELGGQLIANAQEGEISSEIVGLAIAALVLLLTFGNVVAAGLPLATALFGLGISAALIGLLAAVLDVPDWAPALASMLGIGVGIDYALLIVTRYRAALAAGRAPRDAVVESVATAGRSVLIAGHDRGDLAARAVPHGPPVPLRRGARDDHLRARRDGGVGHARAGADGDGRAADRPPAHPGHRPRAGDPDSAPAARWGRAVQRRPWAAAIAGVAVLLLLASPFAGLRLGFPDRGNDATRHDHAAGLRPGVPGLRAGRERPAAARRVDGRPAATATRWRRSPSGCAASRASPSVARAGDEPGRRRRRAQRDPAHLAAGPARPRTSSSGCATDVLPGAGLPVSVGGADGRVRRPEPGDRRPAAAVHRRRGRALVPAAAGQLPLDRDRR